MRRTQAAPVAELIAGVVRQAGVGENTPLAKVRRAWPRVVGRSLAEGARVLRLEKGTIVVEVDSAALGQELAVYHKARILKCLQEETGVRLGELRCRQAGRA
ncbi:MAG: DUF721 domain-containing protein [Planctomycetes bacterium]|nr:DUF721 domain-containing protein [Planctomycetota bacterium]